MNKTWQAARFMALAIASSVALTTHAVDGTDCIKERDAFLPAWHKNYEGKSWYSGWEKALQVFPENAIYETQYGILSRAGWREPMKDDL